MKTLELFSGTKSFSKVAKEFGYEILTVDLDQKLTPDIIADIMDFNVDMLNGYKPDIIWASPPCEKFSVAALGRNWEGKKDGPFYPRNEETYRAMDVVRKTVSIIEELKPKFFYIENPRAMLRKMNLIPYPYTTVTYCQYGFTYMKPTDIWTNNEAWREIAKSCKNGMSCHESAPRGATTGLQGIKGVDKGRIPPNLMREILEYSLIGEHSIRQQKLF